MITLCMFCAPLARVCRLEETCKGVIEGRCARCDTRVGIGEGRVTGSVFKGSFAEEREGVYRQYGEEDSP